VHLTDCILVHAMDIYLSVLFGPLSASHKLPHQHISVLVHHYQGEQLYQFIEKPTTIMTLLSLGSIL